MSAARLRAMVEAATPGPWRVDPRWPLGVYGKHRVVATAKKVGKGRADARLIALSPELARWAADAAAALERARDTAQIFAAGCDTGHLDFTMDDADALLARLAGIVGEPE